MKITIDIPDSFADQRLRLITGVDGTIGVANEIASDATYLYVCLAANTIADANWRRIAVGSVY